MTGVGVCSVPFRGMTTRLWSRSSRGSTGGSRILGVAGVGVVGEGNRVQSEREIGNAHRGVSFLESRTLSAATRQLRDKYPIDCTKGLVESMGGIHGWNP